MLDILDFFGECVFFLDDLDNLDALLVWTLEPSVQTKREKKEMRVENGFQLN